MSVEEDQIELKENGPDESPMEEEAGNRISTWVQSLLHMHVNRMLRSAQREHELVLYDFLVQLYASRRARARHRRAAPAPSTPGVTIG